MRLKIMKIYQLVFQPPKIENLGSKVALTTPYFTSLKAFDVDILPISSV